MAKDPAFLFYTSDFLTGTMLMSDEQVGKYMRLMCYEHQHGRLSEQDMLKICKTHDEDVFSKFDVDESGLYFNERLEIEIGRRRAYSDSRRRNRASTPSYDEHMKNICETHVEHMEIEISNSNSVDNRELKVTGKEVKEGNPDKPKSAPKVNERFEQFWQAYPRKVGKQDAIKAFAKVDVGADVLLAALETQKCSKQWKENNGQFIPHPATWLNGRRWEDELESDERRMQGGQRTGNNQQSISEDAAGDWNLDGITTL